MNELNETTDVPVSEITRKEKWLKAILDSAAEISRLGRAARTQSNVSRGHADLLLELEFRKLDLKHDQRQRVDAFRSAIAKLLTQVNHYLDLSTMESGHFELEKIDFELKFLLERTLESVGAVAAAKQLILKLVFVPGIPKTLAGDPTRLQQIVANLLNSAVQFAESGEIRLTAEADASNAHHLHFGVLFSGSVMPDEKQDEISLCRILVRQMGGELLLRSGSGEGKVFAFDLLFAPGTREPAAKTTMQAALSQGIRILIAEDSEDSRFLLQEFLKRGPYEVTFAENGKIALEAALSQPFDLILMDIQMPVMDGLTATRLIREAEARAGRPAIPLLALTAHTRKADIDLSLAVGCNAHISKPISKSGLLETIQKYAPARGLEKPPMAAAAISVSVPAGLEEAARRYILSKKGDVPRLLQLIAVKDFEQLRKVAHDLKGTGAAYGFPDVTRLGGMMECSAKEQNVQELSGQLLELSRYVQAAAEMAHPLVEATV